jgi:WD40 repeat protein
MIKLLGSAFMKWTFSRHIDCRFFLVLIFLCLLSVTTATALDVSNIQPVWTYGTAAPIQSVSMSSDGQYVGVQSVGHTGYFLSNEGTLLWKVPNSDAGLGISSDGQYVVTGWRFGNVSSYNRDGKLLWSHDSLDVIGSIAISSDDNYIVLGSQGGKVYYLNRNGEILWSHNTGPVEKMAINSDGRYIAAGAFWGKWEVSYLNQNGKLLWNQSIFGCPAVSSNGEDIAVGASDFKLYYFNRDGNLLWNYETKNKLCEINSLAQKIAISSDGQYIAAGSDKIYFFNREGKLLWNFETGSIVKSVAMSSDGRHIVAGSDGNKVYYFNRDGNLLWSFDVGSSVNSVTISSDGQYIATGSSGRKVCYFRCVSNTTLPTQSSTNIPITNSDKHVPSTISIPMGIEVSVISIVIGIRFLTRK